MLLKVQYFVKEKKSLQKYKISLLFLNNIFS